MGQADGSLQPLALLGPAAGAQRLTSVISSSEQPRDQKEHVSKQVQKATAYFDQGVLVVEILIFHKV